MPIVLEHITSMNYVYVYWDKLAGLTIGMAPYLLFIILFAVIAALIAVSWHFFSATASVPIAAILFMIGLLNRLDINFMNKRPLKTISYV